MFAILRTTIELCIYKKCHIFKVLSWKNKEGPVIDRSDAVDYVLSEGGPLGL